MHKDVKQNGNWFGIPMQAGDAIRIIKNDDVMVDFVCPYDDSELSTFIKRMTKAIEFK